MLINRAFSPRHQLAESRTLYIRMLFWLKPLLQGRLFKNAKHGFLRRECLSERDLNIGQ